MKARKEKFKNKTKKTTARFLPYRTRLVDTRARLAAIVESTDDAVIGETLDGTITNWNNGAERIYGYTAKEAVGRPIRILVPHDRPDTEAAVSAPPARASALSADTSHSE